MAFSFSMNVDLEALIKHANDLGSNSQRVFKDYRQLNEDLKEFSDKAMADIKGEQFRTYIAEQEEWMEELEKQFKSYSEFLENEVAPKVKDYLDTPMK